MIKELIALALCLVSLSATFGQSIPEKQLSKSIDDLVTDRLERISPGCAVLVAKNGEIIYQKAFGIADLELNVPTAPGMIFRIGSITKQFTAVAILQLVEQGKISLTDSLQKFIKDFPSRGHTITIENLLTQTSGIPDYLNLQFDIPNPFRIDFTPQQIIDSLKKQPSTFVPASKFEYSNSNYFLLGYIIEKVTGLKYPDYLNRNILTPFNLTNTFYDTPTQIIPNRIRGYEKVNNKYSNADFISMAGFYSSGALLSNVEDLLKWNSALHGYRIISKALLEKAFQPFKLSNGTFSEYGYGWFVRKLGESKTIEHGGSIFGFRAEEIYLPEEGIFVTGLFNCRQLNNDEQELCYDIAKTVTGKPLVEGLTLSDDLLNDYTGTYQLANSPNRTIIITKSKNLLAANVVGQGLWPMLFQSETKFIIKGVDAKCEFIKENGRTAKLQIQQNGDFTWNKIK